MDVQNSNIESLIVGGIEMAINDNVEIVSQSNEELYGAVGKILEIKEDDFGMDFRILTREGLELWIDSQDVVAY
ncbi:hypothetical protein [Paenibacillus chitinolyticus]